MKKPENVLERLILVTFVVLLSWALPASAASPKESHTGETYKVQSHQGENGLGIVLGEPTGLSGKFWIAPHTAIDAGAAYSLNSYIYLYADYLMHLKKPIKTKKHIAFVRQLAPYIGIGGSFGVITGTRVSATTVGIRIPIGIEWLPNDPPLGIFAELVPGISVIPATSGYVGAGVGVRYYF